MRAHYFRCLYGAQFVVVLAALVASAQAVTLDWVPVGNPGNSNDDTGHGAVGYTYAIGKFEVSNSQYVEFLNAKDPTGANALGLYSSSMSSDAQGGIAYSAGNASGTKYSVHTGEGNHPVVFVSWYDCIRFANWMNNGQGNGDTESGAYTLQGNSETPSNAWSITRQPNAKIFLPSDDEWYKAAYYNNSNSTYFEYAVQTDTVPYSDQPSGNPAIQTRVANFKHDDGSSSTDYNDGYAVTGSSTLNTSLNYLTDVGAYTYAPSPYGTFDQAGNVLEWDEEVATANSKRGLRGGAWSQGSAGLMASTLSGAVPTNEYNFVGFRLAMMPVPEPGSNLLAISAAVGLWWLRRRRTELAAGF